MNVLQALKKSTNFVERFTNQSLSESKIEAEHIFMFVLKVSRPKLYEQFNSTLTDCNNKKIDHILELRKNKPLSYILKKHVFYKDEFYINDNVLIPRPETESIIDEVLRQGDLLFKTKKECIFLDAGTGSGCVGITIANERPEWKVLLLELYSEAIEVARINLKLCKRNNIDLICSDWLKPIAKNSFDFIFSNPPYIRINDEYIDDSVRYNEPSTSLFSKKNGLEDINKIIKYSREALSTNGILFLENGVGQSKDISDYLELNDFTDIRVHIDYNGHDRFTSSRKNNG
ncbi:MAG: peptide chain release factor N(5)-glutamine methyltransferase [Gammaproteobacteria bacterium]